MVFHQNEAFSKDKREGNLPLFVVMKMLISRSSGEKGLLFENYLKKFSINNPRVENGRKKVYVKCCGI